MRSDASSRQPHRSRARRQGERRAGRRDRVPPERQGVPQGQRLIVGDDAPAPLDQAARFQTYRRGTIALAAGDLLRFTKNGRTLDGRRINNGSVHTLAGFTPKGDLRLANGGIVARDFGHLTHGYVATSHASQGKTADCVFVGQSPESFAASSRQQFYVTASRARHKMTVYTSGRHELLEAIRRDDDRLTATDIIRFEAAVRRDRVRGLVSHRIRQLLMDQRSGPPAPYRNPPTRSSEYIHER